MFHILFVGPLFLYIGLMKNNTHHIVKKLLIGLGIIVILYHAYSTYTHYSKSKYISYLNLTHVLVFAPLLIYTGIVENAIYPTYDIMFVLGSGITLLSIYKLIK